MGPCRGDLPLGLPRSVAGVLPLCQNLTALHLRHVELKELPALPLLTHLILPLQECMSQPVLVASLRGLASLETLLVRGVWGPEPPAWDARACVRLRRLHISCKLVAGLAAAGQDLCLPPACAVALQFQHIEQWRRWLVRLGSRLAALSLLFLSADVAASRASFMHAPQLLQLRHVTLHVTRKSRRSLCF